MNGDIYKKTVSSHNDESVTNNIYICTLEKSTRVSYNRTDDFDETYTYECEEKDPIWGWLTLSFAFILPGIFPPMYLFFTKQDDPELDEECKYLFINTWHISTK